MGSHYKLLTFRMNRSLLLLFLFPLVTFAAKVPLYYYPKEALENCIEGHVTLSFMVKSENEVTNISVIESYPDGMFEGAAIKYLKESVKMYKTEDASGQAEMDYSFSLPGVCEKES